MVFPQSNATGTIESARTRCMRPKKRIRNYSYTVAPRLTQRLQSRRMQFSARRSRKEARTSEAVPLQGPERVQN
jgi:hypothetical protein